MDTYFKKYKTYTIKVVYYFKNLNGGIGDYLKYFMYLLYICIKKKYRLYFLIDNEIFIKQYLVLHNKEMYIRADEIGKNKKIIIHYNEFMNLKNNNKFNLIRPGIFYRRSIQNPILKNISSIFSFSNEIVENQIIKKYENMDYISLHIRLGDKFLEVKDKFKNCLNDERVFKEENVFDFLENHKDQNIMLFCDNQEYKEKLKKKYKNITITSLKIGHVGLKNTKKESVFDTVIEFYLLTKSKKIYTPTYSGFSKIASIYKDIPLIYI